jgi:hypothetical protein
VIFVCKELGLRPVRHKSVLSLWEGNRHKF